MGTTQTLIFLVVVWLIILATELFTVSVIKDKTPKIVSDIKEKVSNSTNKVEIVTEQMDVDMEEGVMNEYYNRF